MKILVTGAAGFIGYHLVSRLLMESYDVVGIDNLNNYYDAQLKKDRINILERKSEKRKNFIFLECDISDKENQEVVFEKHNIDVVINLAAQAGVRYSLENPSAYISSNIIGFQNILDACVKFKTKKIIFASSSSVYGGNKSVPYNEADVVSKPESLYAATKISNEVVAHSYAHLYNIPIVGLRFFTVYGIFGRPDMAYYKFTNKILKKEKIDVYAMNEMKRDFTHISDIVEGIMASLKYPDLKNSFELFNLGNSEMVELSYLVHLIEKNCLERAEINHLPKQKGDVLMTYADISKAKKYLNYSPKVKIEDGIKEFVEWYKVFTKA